MDNISLLQEFVRLRHKCKGVVWRLHCAGGSGFQFIADRNNPSGDLKLRAEKRVPDEETMLKFIVLTRRFLDSTSPIFYKNVWSIIQNEFPSIISNEIIRDMEDRITQLEEGIIEFTLNGKVLSQEDRYHIMAEGGIFDTKFPHNNILKDIQNNPFLGPVFDALSINDYSIYSMSVIERLFKLIKDAEYSSQYSIKFKSSKVQCIYCLDKEGSFDTVEHIVPEALGNYYEYVLPKGFACNRCNNSLSKIDKKFISFTPISLLRTLFIPYTKKGKYPTVQFPHKTEIARTSPRTLVVRFGNKNPLQGTTLVLPRKNFTEPEDIGRALYKIALGYVALKYGHDVACQPRFNAARNFIKTGNGAPNDFLIRLKDEPIPDIVIKDKIGKKEIEFPIQITGLKLNQVGNNPLNEVTIQLQKCLMPEVSIKVSSDDIDGDEKFYIGINRLNFIVAIEKTSNPLLSDVLRNSHYESISLRHV